MQSRLGWLLLSVLVSASILVFAQIGRPDPTQRNFETITDMVYSPAFRAYDTNPVWSDGKTLQALPQGTVPRHFRPFPFGPNRPGFENADAEMKLAGEHWPMPDAFKNDTDPAIVARGDKLFATFCATCHGKTGAGDGTIAHYLQAAQFPLFDRTAGMKDGELFYIITRGGRGGVMAPHASQISPDDRWRLIRYLRTVEPKPTE